MPPLPFTLCLDDGNDEPAAEFASNRHFKQYYQKQLVESGSIDAAGWSSAMDMFARPLPLSIRRNASVPHSAHVCHDFVELLGGLFKEAAVVGGWCGDVLPSRLAGRQRACICSPSFGRA
jgi:hypothetical protein